MKFKHLFNNMDLAIMLLENWDYDRNRMDMLQHFRISANCVYPFIAAGTVNFLRFTPTEETTEAKIRGELDFLAYLHSKGYPAVATLPSKAANELEIAETPWGKYYAVAFRGAAGKALSTQDPADDVIWGWGQALGRLHRLSAAYKPAVKQREDWKMRLIWIKEVLQSFPAQDKAYREAELLEAFFAALPVTGKNYGLIHYDFESDNIFYDAATGGYNPFDFDDAVYHWFVMDIEISLASMKTEMNTELPPEKYEHGVEQFMAGYRNAMDVDAAVFTALPVFRRYADLFTYTRILRAAAEEWKNEHAWMAELRVKLAGSMERKSKMFGAEIV